MSEGNFGPKPLVSIVIPTYGQDSSICRAINSALRQTYQNIEVIVLDDASPDKTEDRVRTIVSSKVIYVRNHSNIGRVANYHKGLYEYVKGDWVLFLDGDDYLFDDTFVADAVERISVNPKLVIVSGNIAIERSSVLTELHHLRAEQLNGLQLIKRLPQENGALMHLATLYNRDKARKIGFYELDVLSTDWDSLYRLAISGEVALMSRVVAVWSLHEKNASSTKLLMPRIENLAIWGRIFDFAKKHGMNSFRAQQKKIACLQFFILMDTKNSVGFIEKVRYLSAAAIRYPLPVLLAPLNFYVYSRVFKRWLRREGQL
jgi:glycosyltransferase involved in cell wall biosynthesis